METDDADRSVGEHADCRRSVVLLASALMSPSWESCIEVPCAIPVGQMLLRGSNGVGAHSGISMSSGDGTVAYSLEGSGDMMIPSSTVPMCRSASLAGGSTWLFSSSVRMSSTLPVGSQLGKGGGVRTAWPVASEKGIHQERPLGLSTVWLGLPSQHRHSSKHTGGVDGLGNGEQVPAGGVLSGEVILLGDDV